MESIRKDEIDHLTSAKNIDNNHSLPIQKIQNLGGIEIDDSYDQKNVVKGNIIQRHLERSNANVFKEYNFEVHGIKKKYTEKSLLLFKSTNKIRYACVWLMEWRWYKHFMTLIIFLNTLSLAIYDYDIRINPGLDSWRNDIVTYSDPIFLSCYISEFLIKIIAIGAITEDNTYFRNGWNILDFIVIISGIMDYIPQLLKFTGIRGLRMLRPLKSITKIEGIKKLVSGLLLSLPELFNIALFLAFLIVIFTLFGLQFFNGIYEQRCRITPHPINNTWPIVPDHNKLCGKTACPENSYCGNPSLYGIPRNWSEINNEDFYWGIPNFDTFYNGTLTIFQIITPVGWFDVMKIFWNAFDPVVASIYFCGIICFVTFYLINLILAAINESFVRITLEEKELESPPFTSKEEVKFEHNNSSQNSHKHHESIIELPEGDKYFTNQLQLPKQKAEAQKHHHQLNQLHNESGKKSLIPKNETKLKPNDSTLYSLKRNHIELSDISYFKEIIIPDGQIEQQDQSNRSREKTLELSNKKRILPTLPAFPQFGLFMVIKLFFRRLAFNPRFQYFSICIVLANIGVLAANRYPQSNQEAKILEIFNNLFTFYFLVEMFIKMIGLGFREYFKDYFNIFDTTLVLIGVIEIIIVASGIQGSGLRIITAFRALRLLGLGRKWKSLRNLLLALFSTLKDLRNFAILLFIFMIVAALLGMQFFAYQARFIDDEIADDPTQGQSPRINFDAFFNAMLAVFCIMINEAWHEIMYNYVRTTGSASVLYFTLVVIIGEFILFKLFLAILIDNFSMITRKQEEKEAEEHRLNPKKHNKNQNSINYMLAILCCKIPEKSKEIAHIDPKEISKSENELKALKDNKEDDQIVVELIDNQSQSQSQSQIKLIQKSKNSNIHKQQQQQQCQQNEYHIKNDNKTTTTPSKRYIQRQQQQRHHNKKLISVADFIDQNSSVINANNNDNNPRNLEYDPLTKKFKPKKLFIQGKSLFIFNKENKLRHIIHDILKSKIFIWIIFLNIIANAVSVSIQNPLSDPQDIDQIATYYIDIITNVVFTIEIIMKCITYGLIINGPKSILKQSWTRLDFIIILADWINFSIYGNENIDLYFSVIITIIRALRPLRLISNNEGLKLAIKSIFSAMPSILNLTVVVIVFFFVFSIFGVQYFKGEFYYCDLNNLSADFEELIHTKLDCMDYGGDWINNPNNFDNVIIGMVTLFKISTTGGWTNLMYLGIDSVDIDVNPIVNNGPIFGLYYILFIILGVLFVLSFFIALVVDFFSIEKGKLGGMNFLTPEQQEWVQMKMTLMDIKPQAKWINPTNIISVKCRKIVDSRWFNNIIAILLIINTLVFCLVWSRQDTSVQLILTHISTTLIALFVIETIIKITAWSFNYFRDFWNSFDFIIIILSLISIVIDNFLISSAPIEIAHIIRTFRCARILRLIIQLKRLRTIYTTIVVTLPSMLNIGGFLCLVLYIYTNVGNNLFCFLKHGDGINEDANFKNFHKSFITLFKVATLEEWFRIFDDCARSAQPNYACIDIQSSDDYAQYGIIIIMHLLFPFGRLIHFLQFYIGLEGCGNSWAYPYFISFQYIFTLVFMNLFVAVIIEAYKECIKMEKAQIKPKDIQNFKELWKKYDPKGLSIIAHEDLKKLVTDLDPPLGRISCKLRPLHLKRFLYQLDLPAYYLRNNGKANSYHYFNDVLIALTKSYIHDIQDIQKDLDEITDDGNHKRIKIQSIILQKVHQRVSKIPKINYSPFKHSELLAAQTIMEYLKIYKKNIMKPEENIKLKKMNTSNIKKSIEKNV